jgi:hypothetical protein
VSLAGRAVEGSVAAGVMVEGFPDRSSYTTFQGARTWSTLPSAART